MDKQLLYILSTFLEGFRKNVLFMASQLILVRELREKEMEAHLAQSTETQFAPSDSLDSFEQTLKSLSDQVDNELTTQTENIQAYINNEKMYPYIKSTLTNVNNILVLFWSVGFSFDREEFQRGIDEYLNLLDTNIIELKKLIDMSTIEILFWSYTDYFLYGGLGLGTVGVGYYFLKGK